MNKGVVTPYDAFGAAIYAETAENLSIKNNLLSNSSMGIFVNSKGGEEWQSRDILVEGNTFTNLGVSGENHEHDSYIEATNTLYQFNHYSRQKDSSGGSSLKDRSSGTVIRYNYIQSTARAIDLVEGQSGFDINALAPNYEKAFVYGNIIENGSYVNNAGNLIHYGGDQYDPNFYRGGTLIFLQQYNCS